VVALLAGAFFFVEGLVELLQEEVGFGVANEPAASGYLGLPFDGV
jgi:hypothetical protein